MLDILLKNLEGIYCCATFLKISIESILRFRKKCLLANNALTFFAAALIGFSKLASSYEMLIIGRFFAGIQCGD